MNTDELIRTLATHPEPVAARTTLRHSLGAVGVGLPLTLLLMAGLLGFNPNLVQLMSLPMFWVKLAYVVSLAVLAFIVVGRVARPGCTAAWPARWLIVPWLVIVLLAGFEWFSTPQAQRASLLWGVSWAACPINIALLSLPTLITGLWVMTRLAPTQPMIAGASAGLLAGAIGAVAYTLHCPEFAATFLGIWYALGMLVPAIIGALLGPRLLRW